MRIANVGTRPRLLACWVWHDFPSGVLTMRSMSRLGWAVRQPIQVRTGTCFLRTPITYSLIKPKVAEVQLTQVGDHLLLLLRLDFPVSCFSWSCWNFLVLQWPRRWPKPLLPALALHDVGQAGQFFGIDLHWLRFGRFLGRRLLQVWLCGWFWGWFFVAAGTSGTGSSIGSVSSTVSSISSSTLASACASSAACLLASSSAFSCAKNSSACVMLLISIRHPVRRSQAGICPLYRWQETAGHRAQPWATLFSRSIVHRTLSRD